MKKILFTFVFGFIFSVTFSQVGINTPNPQQEVHVSGTTENIRVDGLNETNNDNNLGVGSSTRVFVDTNGDLKLGTVSQTVEMLVDSENYLQDAETPSNLVNQTGTAFGYNIAGIPAEGYGAKFTLTKNAIVEVNYSISWSIYKTGGKAGRIADNHARIVQMGMFFTEGNWDSGVYVINNVEGDPINGGPWCIQVNSSGTVCQEQGGMLALNGQFYNNVHKAGGEYKNFRNTGSDFVKLGPGTYTAMFAVQLAVGDTGGTGAVKLYLGSGKDDVQIIAHYYN